MRFVLRHPVSVVLVLGACAATGAVLVFARPEYHPRYESKMIDFSKQRYYSPERVRTTFAGEGVQLPYASRFSGFTTFSRVRVPQASALQVMVAPHTGRGSWGPKLERYDVRFGNVAVMYGGRDESLLARVQAAVTSLRNA